MLGRKVFRVFHVFFHGCGNHLPLLWFEFDSQKFAEFVCLLNAQSHVYFQIAVVFAQQRPHTLEAAQGVGRK